MECCVRVEIENAASLVGDEAGFFEQFSLSSLGGGFRCRVNVSAWEHPHVVFLALDQEDLPFVVDRDDGGAVAFAGCRGLGCKSDWPRGAE